MAKEEQSFKFDKNEITRALLGKKYYDWLSTFRSIFEKTQERSLFSSDEQFREFIDRETSREHTNDVILGRCQYELETNPKSEFATEFRKYWDFAKCIFYPNYDKEYVNNYKLILSKIDTFAEDIQLDILNRLQYTLSGKGLPDLIEIINTKIANNKKASTEDKVHAAYGLLHKNHDIVRDVIELLKQDLDKELKSDFPNNETIKTICVHADGLMIRLQESFSDNDPYVHKIQNALSKDYIKTVREEFDINKVLAGDTEYVPQINKSLEERAVNAEKQAHEATKQAQKYEETNIRLNRLQMEYNDIVRQLESEKSKNEHLTGELNLLNKQVEKQNLFIKSVRMKIGQLKTGLLAGNGVKDLQQFINNDHTL